MLPPEKVDPIIYCRRSGVRRWIFGAKQRWSRTLLRGNTSTHSI